MPCNVQASRETKEVMKTDHFWVFVRILPAKAFFIWNITNLNRVDGLYNDR